MRVVERAPLPHRHGRDEVRRNLVRLAGLQAVVLDEGGGSLGGFGVGEVPASPRECLYEALAVVARLAGGAAGSWPGVRRELEPGYLAYLLGLLARVAFPHARDREARSIFLGYLAEALEAGEPAGAAVLGAPLEARGRLLALVRRPWRGERRWEAPSGGRGGGESVVSAVVRVGVAVYYLADALGIFCRLTPPCRPPWPPPTSTPSPGTSPPPGTRSGSGS